MILPHASIILAGAPGSVAAEGHATIDAPFAGGINALLYTTVYVNVQSAVLLSQAVYRYVHTTVPLQVTGFGLEVEPTSTGVSELPQASRILAGAPGSVASAGHATVDEPLEGGVSVPL